MATVAQTNQEKAASRKAAEGWLHIRLDPDDRRLLKIRAAEEEITMAEACRRAISSYLGKAA